MPIPLLDSNQIFLVGEKKPLGVIISDQLTAGTDLSNCTATIKVLSSTGTTILAETSASTSGTTSLTVSKIWDTTGISAGCYRAIVKVTVPTTAEIYKWQWVVMLVTDPAPQ